MSADNVLHIRIEDDTLPGSPAAPPAGGAPSTPVPTSAPPPPVPPIPRPPIRDTRAENLVRTVRESAGGLSTAREAELRAEAARGQLDGPRIMELLERFTATAASAGLPTRRPSEPPADQGSVPRGVTRAARVRSSLQNQREREEEAVRAGQESGVTQAARVRASLARQREREETTTLADQRRQVDQGARVRSSLARQKAQAQAAQQAAVTKAARVRASLDRQRERERKEREREAQRQAKEQRDARLEQNQNILNLGDGSRALIQPGQSLAGRWGGFQQVASSGALGQGAAAMAGGPVGMAVTAALAVREAVHQIPGAIGGSIRDAMSGMARIGQSAARNDGAAVLETAAEGTAKALDNLGLHGKVAGEAVRTFATAVTATKAAIDSFADRGRELAPFDGRIAEAAAIADVRKRLGDMGEARRMGDLYARTINNQADIGEMLRQALEPFKVRFMELLDRGMPLFEAAAAALESIVPAIDYMSDVAGNVNEFLKFVMPGWRLIADEIEANARDRRQKRDAKAAAAAAEQARETDRLILDMLADADRLIARGGFAGDAGRNPGQADLDRANRELRMPIVGGP